MKRAALAALAAALAACRGAAPLPQLGQTPEFELTAQDGRPFHSRALSGHVWVADFIFTNCAGPCPMMTARMARLQKQTPASVRLVSFTVDPERDTPEALARFAAQFHADPARWHFLTGARAALDAVALGGFHLNPVEGALNHSTRFALVDARGQIRGYYPYGDPAAMDNLAAAIRQLEREK